MCRLCVGVIYGVARFSGCVAEMSCPQAESASVPSGTDTAWAIAWSVLTVQDFRPCSMSTIILRETPDRAANPSRVRPAACLAAATARPSDAASYGKGSFAGSSSRSRKKLLHTTGARCCLHRHRTGCRIWRTCARRSGARKGPPRQVKLDWPNRTAWNNDPVLACRSSGSPGGVS